MARIGYLYLRGGRWEDQQVVPEDFIGAAGTSPFNLPGFPWQTIPIDICRRSPTLRTTVVEQRRRSAVQCTARCILELGLGDSLIVVIPSLDIVASRAGSTWSGDWDPDYHTVLRPFIEPIALSASAGQTETAAQPSISPNGGTFTGPVTVTLATATAGAEIYYTLDGTAPTPESLLYRQPFELSASADFRAAAYLEGYTPSAVASASFVIGTPPPVLEPIGDKTATEEQNISFTVRAGEPEPDTPLLSADFSDLPWGTFTDKGDGTGLFSWTPRTGDAANSPYGVTSTAASGDIRS